MSEIRGTIDALHALAEYMVLSNEIAELEARESTECVCDSSEFHLCDLCEYTGEKRDRRRELKNLWCDKWALLLAHMLMDETAVSRMVGSAALLGTLGGGQ